MCDKKAVEMVAKSWGTTVYTLKTRYCRPTPENPRGYAYATDAEGPRAEAIMRGYEPEIIGTEIHKKWQEIKRQYERER